MSGGGDAGAWFQPRQNVVARMLEGEMVLVQLESGEIYRLNETAARLWQLAAEGLDRTTAEQRLLEEFEVEVDRLSEEIDALLKRLMAAELADVQA